MLHCLCQQNAHVGSNDDTKQEFTNSAQKCVDVKLLGPAQWFLQMHSHQQKHKPTQHLINIATFSTLCNISMPIPNSLNMKFHYHLTSPSAKTTVQSLIMTCTFLEDNANMFPFALLYVHHLTLPTTPLQSATLQSLHLFWKFQLLCSYLAYRLPITMPIQHCQILRRRQFQSCLSCTGVCHKHCILRTNFTISSDASWQDCPDTDHSTIRFIILHNGILIKANSTMPTPIAMSNSEDKYMAACSTSSMANPH